MALSLKDRLARQATGDHPLNLPLPDPEDPETPRLVDLPLTSVEPDPNQPRQHLGDVTGLADSIRAHGLLSPLVVEPLAPGRYRILAGERRYAACRQLKWDTLPCLVRTVAEHSRLTLQLIENLQRQDLHPVEEARAVRRLMDECNLTQREVAERLGKSLAAVNQTLRILDLDETVLARVQTSEHATKSVLLEIAKAPDLRRQMALLDQAEAGTLTVRAARWEKAAGPATGKQVPSKADTATITLSFPEATVVIRFRHGPATPAQVLAILEQALAQQRQRATPRTPSSE
jgi:ParB family chromosome partitioning protein